MTPPELMEWLHDKLIHEAKWDAPMSAKQLMDISKGFNYFMAEQIQKAPCDHVGEYHYETIGGRYCGTCCRRIESDAVCVK